MFASIFSALISSGLKFFLSLFGKSKDEERGALKVDNVNKEQELKNVEKSKEIADRIDGLKLNDADKLRADLNDRD